MKRLLLLGLLAGTLLTLAAAAGCGGSHTSKDAIAPSQTATSLEPATFSGSKGGLAAPALQPPPPLPGGASGGGKKR